MPTTIWDERDVIFGRWKQRGRRADRPAGAKGWRAYAIGDVHGRLDLLEALLARIERDHHERGGRVRPLLIFVGDLIDRGPDSAGVVEKIASEPLSGFKTVALTGNHEEVFLRLIDNREPALLAEWLRFGGDNTVRSYGGDPDLLARIPEGEALDRLSALVPPRHFEFLSNLGDTFRFGTYLFVHAGLRPGVALEEQVPTDLRWIRSAFLDDPRDHGPMIVHGHTISERIDERHNRIGIDTGAYKNGILSAIAIEGKERWFLQTGKTPSARREKSNAKAAA